MSVSPPRQSTGTPESARSCLGFTSGLVSGVTVGLFVLSEGWAVTSSVPGRKERGRSPTVREGAPVPPTPCLS